MTVLSTEYRFLLKDGKLDRVVETGGTILVGDFDVTEINK
jgi:hypothetical protein